MISLGEIVGCDLPFPHGICLPGWTSGVLVPGGAQYVPDRTLADQASQAVEQAQPGPVPCGMAALGGLGAVEQAADEIRRTGHCNWAVWGETACVAAWSLVRSGSSDASRAVAPPPAAPGAFTEKPVPAVGSAGAPGWIWLAAGAAALILLARK